MQIMGGFLFFLYFPPSGTCSFADQGANGSGGVEAGGRERGADEEGAKSAGRICIRDKGI